MLVDLGDPDGRSAWTVSAADGRTFAVFVLDGGALRVSDAACPHLAGPLVEGRVRGAELRCPWHGHRFDLDTGACRSSALFALRVHPVVDVDGRPHADVGPGP